MELKLLFIIQCTIFCSQYDFIYGYNVRNARSREFPYVVAIKRVDNRNPRPEKDHICGGVLISYRDVLTISRCFEGSDVTNLELIVGTINYRGGVKHFPLWWMTFDRWALSRTREILFPHNEITIIRLTHSVAPTTSPIVLSTSQNPHLHYSTVQTAGWGELMIGMVPRIMRTAVLYPLINSLCQEKIDKIYEEDSFTLQGNYICTYGDHRDEWHVIDIGGPLLFDGQLIGINQETHPVPRYPPHLEKVNMHVRIDYYIEFIEDVTLNL